MQFTDIFFDLDDTLYPSQAGLWQAIRDRMNDYLFEVMHLPQAEALALRRRYYETYGTTLRGLQLNHQIDVDHYLAYVHDLPLAEFIQPMPGLRALIESLPQRRWIFTNADAAHAGRVLTILGLQGLFEQIIDVRALDWAPKPSQEAYLRALAIAGSPDPHRCVLLDDSPRNLAPARELGFTTVIVSANGNPTPEANLCISSVLDLPKALPQLWLQEV